MAVVPITEKEMLQAQSRQIFNIEKLLNEEMISLRDLEEMIPGLFHINSPVDSRLLYVSKSGCDFLKMEREELLADSGVEQLMELVSPDTFRYEYPKFMTFYAEEDNHKVLGAFQQVKPRGEEGYTWLYTTTKIYQRLQSPISISIPVLEMGDLGGKIESMLDDNVFMRKNYLRFATLTKREREVMEQVALGKKRRQISDEMCISLHTYDTHRKNIREKLELKSFADLMRYARAFGLVC